MLPHAESMTLTASVAPWVQAEWRAVDLSHLEQKKKQKTDQIYW